MPSFQPPTEITPRTITRTVAGRNQCVQSCQMLKGGGGREGIKKTHVDYLLPLPLLSMHSCNIHIYLQNTE